MIAVLEKEKDDTARGHIFKVRVLICWYLGRIVGSSFLHKVLPTVNMVMQSENKNPRLIHTPDTDIFGIRISSPT